MPKSKNDDENSIIIVRPPLSRTFDVPTPDELLKVFQGDSVKLIFQAGDQAERMWVTVTRSGNMDEWEGELANEPATAGIASKVSYGDTIRFHPYDVVDIDLHKRPDQKNVEPVDEEKKSDVLVNKIDRPWYKNAQIIVTILVGVLGAVATILAAVLTALLV